MARTISITEHTAAELLSAASTSGPYLMALSTKAELISLLAPPVVKPPGPQSVPGYSRVIWKEWRDDSVPLPPINTVDEGGWVPGSLLVVAFTPTRAGSASIAPWPNDGTMPRQRVAISTTPGDFSMPFPYSRSGQNVGIQWQVGGASRTNCVLAAGTRYYLSYAWDGQDMRVQV